MENGNNGMYTDLMILGLCLPLQGIQVVWSMPM